MRTLVSICAFCFLLQACSHSPTRGGYYMDDGPHSHIDINIHEVEDAVPRSEPLSKSGNQPYIVFGKKYYPMQNADDYRKRGMASWYGKKFHGKRTSSGEIYNMYTMSAAHKTLPIPSYARVTNLDNGKSVVVRVNDRGPFLHNRLIDLSYVAAAKLDIANKGTGMVEVSVIKAQDGDTQKPEANNDMEGDAPVTATRPQDSRLYLQVGAFSDQHNAESLRSRLQAELPLPVSIASKTNGDTRVYRVRIGPLSTLEQGTQLTQDIGRYGISDAIIITE